MDPRMTSYTAGMAPTEDLGPGRIRNVQSVGGSISRIRLCALSPLDCCLKISGDHSDHLGSRENGVRSNRISLRRVNPRQCVGFTVLGTWPVRQSEVEPAKEQSPACLARVQPPG